MYINERKIIHVIDECIKSGERRFAIFPYGKWGKVVKKILNNKFNIQEIAIIDNLVTGNEEIIKMDSTKDICGTYTILFATDKKPVHDELLVQLQSMQNVQVCDIAMYTEKKPLYFSMNSDKLQIEDCNQEQRNVIFEKTRMVWEKLGSAEPYWSVLTSDEYRIGNMNEVNLEKFYKTGHSACLSIIKTLERADVIHSITDVSDLEITEIGCGTGRVTKSLATHFGKVNAYDISPGNLQIAEKMIKNKNVNFCLIKHINEYEKLPQTDVIYSMIVLQHNCPTVIEYMLECMFRSLRRNGVCIFQVPTYKDNYTFKYEDYINYWEGKMEMHVLPQKKIFEIAFNEQCIPVEVYQDSLTGNDDFSTTFVFRKVDL